MNTGKVPLNHLYLSYTVTDFSASAGLTEKEVKTPVLDDETSEIRSKLLQPGKGCRIFAPKSYGEFENVRLYEREADHSTTEIPLDQELKPIAAP